MRVSPGVVWFSFFPGFWGSLFRPGFFLLSSLFQLSPGGASSVHYGAETFEELPSVYPHDGSLSGLPALWYVFVVTPQ